MSEPLTIFISYAHADEPFKDRLLSTLTVLQRQQLVKTWTDRQIDGGSDWRSEINQALDGCDLALLLISPAFLDSDFIQSIEMARLMERKKTDGIRIVPIIVRPSMWKLDRSNNLQALPRDGKAIITFPEETGARDQVWVEIGLQIAKWAETFLAKQLHTAQTRAPDATSVALCVDSASIEPGNPINPFNPWQPAVPPRFFGRESELRCLANALDGKRSVSLVGDWRIGKSSLLETWKIMTEGRGRVVRLLSGQGPEAVSCALFVGAITNGVVLDDPELAANALATWAAKVAPAGLPPLVLVDEADAVLQRLPHRFFERLRGLVNQQKLCLVLASRRELDQIYQESGDTSPFMNLLEMRRIGLLEQNAAEHLIALGGMLFDDNCRELIRFWAGRHPNYLALLGRHLWDACQYGSEIGEAIEAFNDEAAVRIRDLWKTVSERDRAALCKVLDGQSAEISLGGMKRRGLVVKDRQDIQIFGEVLAAWIREQR